MTDREVEQRFARAVESSAPDILDELLLELPPQQERESDKNDKIVNIETARPKKRRWVRYVVSLAAAVAVAVGIFGFSRYAEYNRVDSLIGLDVNPSIELGLNRSQRVIQVNALNQDGETIIGGIDLIGTDLDVAVNALIGSMLTNGYISDLANSVLVTVSNDDPNAASQLQQQISAEIESLLSVTSSGGAVLSQTVTADQTIDEIASQYGISQGKAALIQEIMAGTVTYTVEELASMSINELALLMSNPAVSVQGVESTGQASDKAYIGSEAAAQAAYAHAGVQASEVQGLEVEFDHDDGRMVYDVEFYAGGYEYDYEVDASSGEVIKYEVEGGQSWSPSPSQDSSGDAQLTSQEALEIALAAAGVERSQAEVEKSELDWDDGVLTYEVEFKAGRYEYEYKIDATTGQILESDWDDD